MDTVMYDGVSEALTLRSAGRDGFWSMLGLSSIGHFLLVVVIVAVPGVLGLRTVPEEREVMSISLGGAPGPRAGGMTPMGGQPVQQATPEPPKPREAPRTPAARQPEMTIPTRTQKPRPQREQLKSAPEDATSTRPTVGPREQLGSTIAQTGGIGASLGLSTGGGGTGGEIKIGDFCCPEYLSTMLQLIQRNWNSKQQVAGVSAMQFTIRRDGSITDIEVAKSSGYTALDLAAQRAIGLTKLPPLPAPYTNPQLTISLLFQYQ
jgi:TonB family protein